MQKDPPAANGRPRWDVKACAIEGLPTPRDTGYRMREFQIAEPIEFRHGHAGHTLALFRDATRSRQSAR
jgi:hypothetical protein